MRCFLPSGRELRGLKVVSVALGSVTLPDEDAR